MRRPNDGLQTVPRGVTQEYRRLAAALIASDRWRQYKDAFFAVWQAALSNAKFSDPRFNAVHWAIDVNGLCDQIAYSYLMMDAHALHYRHTNAPDAKPLHVDFGVAYYADNALTRAHSCRDKVALLVWSFFCVFNPEEKVLEFDQIMDELQRLGGSETVVILRQPLKRLRGLHAFRMVKHYRDAKIHRREPIISLYSVAPHHGWPYVVPGDDGSETPKKLDKQVWAYDEVEKSVRAAMERLLEVSAACFTGLLNLPPLRVP